MIALLILEEERHTWRSFFQLADDSDQAIDAYLYDGTLYGIEKDGAIVGTIQVVWSDEMPEIKNMAVLPDQQGQGIGKAAIEELVGLLKEADATSVMVGTANSSIGNLVFYQRAGFRLDHIRPDYFAHYDPPVTENGIIGRDLVVLVRNFT